MKRYTPTARIWIVVVIVAAVAITAQASRSFDGNRDAWLPFAVLVFTAAVAHFFPIRAGAAQASYRLTSVFLIAGSVILPGALITPLVFLALAPESYRDRKRTTGVTRWLFNTAQAILAAHAAHAIAAHTPTSLFHTPIGLLMIIGAALAFTVVQNLIVAIVIMLHAHKKFREIEILQPSGLITEGLIGLFGVLTAGLWFAAPWLLVLVAPFVLIAHRFTQVAVAANGAHVDAKTGVLDALGLRDAMDSALQRSARMNSPLSVLFIDLDNFKSVNDRYGHIAGDFVLRDFATVLTGTLRGQDVVARFGGEEFVALLPDTNTEQATSIAERLRQTIETTPFRSDLNGNTFHCTASIGISSTGDRSDAKALLEAADLAMYQAKRLHNSVSVSEEARAVVATASADVPVRPRMKTHIFTRVLMRSVVLWSTVITGATVFAFCAWHIDWQHEWVSLLPLLALALVADLFPVQVYRAHRDKITVTLTDAVVVAAVVLHPLFAPVIAVGASTVHIIKLHQRRTDKVLFNLTNPAFAAGLAVAVYLVINNGTTVLNVRGVIAMLATTITLLAGNTGVVAAMISLHSHRSYRSVIRDMLWFGPFTFLIMLTGAFLGSVSRDYGTVGAVLFVIPVMLVRISIGYAAKKNEEALEALETAKANLEVANAKLEKAHIAEQQTQRQLIETVSSIIDARDNMVWGHSRNVADYARLIAQELGMDDADLPALYSAGLLHDLGKVAIPEAILHKPGKLTTEEFTIVKEHPTTGRRILAGVESLHDVAQMVGDHHERFDGNGYPYHKVGDEITIGGRILAVADTLDSILSDRSYSSARTLAAAIAEIDHCAGNQFDPAVVAALHSVVAAKGEAYFTNSALTATTRSKENEAGAQIIRFPRERAS